MRRPPFLRVETRARLGSSIEILEARVCPSTFTVGNLLDAGAGSLRDAVAAANARPGLDHIIFGAGATGLLALTGGELLLTDSVIISGPGVGKLSISGGDTSRIFNISGQATTITDLTLRDGYASGVFGNGGALQLTGTGKMTLDSVAITASRADQKGGGVYIGSGTTAELVNVSIFGDRSEAGGGGIGSAGILVLQSTQVAGNRTQGNGGGIESTSGGVLALYSSVLGNNFAAGGGGGLRNTSSSTSTSSGGETAGTVAMQNTTVAGNVCLGSPGGGAISSSAGGIFMTFCTVTGNSDTSDTSTSTGGISIAGTTVLFINQSIIAENGAGAGHGPDFDGTLGGSGANVVGSSTGASGFEAGDTIGTNAGVTPLADHGGSLPTMLVLSSSAAINKAGNSSLLGDARGIGYARQANGGADSGATEMQVAGTFALVASGTLHVHGTAVADKIAVTKIGTNLQVNVNGIVNTFPAAGIARITVAGFAGNDRIVISEDITLPTLIDGGAGNDKLKGGGGNDQISGRGGNDQIFGRVGKDVLFGGAGADQIDGGSGSDVLLGGVTRFDFDPDRLLNLLIIWGGASGYSSRSDALNLGTAFDLDSSLQTYDATGDRLTGGAGRDLFYSGKGDARTDTASNETLVTVR